MKQKQIYIVAVIGAITILAAVMLIVNAKSTMAAGPAGQATVQSAQLMVCPEPDYTQCQMEYSQADCRALLCKPNNS